MAGFFWNRGQEEPVVTKLYRVDLSEEERAALLALTQKGKVAARRLRRAQILLLADEGRIDTEIAAALHVGLATVERTRKRFVEEGFEASLSERARPGRVRRLDGHQEAFLVALACSDPPEGRSVWTMQLLAERLVGLGVVESVSDETVRRRLKERNSSRGSKSAGAPRP
jgi:transposase